MYVSAPLQYIIFFCTFVFNMVLVWPCMAMDCSPAFRDGPVRPESRNGGSVETCLHLILRVSRQIGGARGKPKR
ncbi:hypothetical protein C8R47DRAFT_1091669 [Mycena vitilis]|nr:hypothetical protein C8R47DRAFT_1091669 [Mycena vitilis]